MSPVTGTENDAFIVVVRLGEPYSLANRESWRRNKGGIASNASSLFWDGAFLFFVTGQMTILVTIHEGMRFYASR